MLRTMEFSLAGFEEAIRKYRPALVTFAYRLLRDVHEAEDSVQAGMARALGAIRSGETPLNIRAWLYKFVLREAQRILEKSSVRRRGLRSSPLLSAEGASGQFSPDPESRLRLHQRVLAEVDGLPDDFRKIILLRFCQHLSYEEVSETLQMPVGTVKSYQARALRLLRERLGFQLDQEA